MTFEQWAQSRLTAHGFPCGPIDGVIGSGTRAALRAFQATRALPITGAADDATVAALKAPSSRLPGDEPRPVGEPQPGAARPVWPTQAEVADFYGEVGASQGSLALPAVKDAIARGRPLIAGFDSRTETRPLGGHGLATG